MRSNLLTRIGLSLALITLLNFPFGCATLPKEKPSIKPPDPAIRQELLLKLGIPLRFHDYREKFLKIPCHSKSVDRIMGGVAYHLHYYLVPGGDNEPDVIEYYPFENGVESEHPLFYVFDINGDGEIQKNKEVYADILMDSLNGNEFLLPMDMGDNQEHKTA